MNDRETRRMLLSNMSAIMAAIPLMQHDLGVDVIVRQVHGLAEESAPCVVDFSEHVAEEAKIAADIERTLEQQESRNATFDAIALKSFRRLEALRALGRKVNRLMGQLDRKNEECESLKKLVKGTLGEAALETWQMRRNMKTESERRARSRMERGGIDLAGPF